MTPEEATKEIDKLKELLWLRHGCSIAALYGDDGEMQCSSCGLDFKRFTASQIEEHFRTIAMQKFSIEVNFNDLAKAI